VLNGLIFLLPWVGLGVLCGFGSTACFSRSRDPLIYTALAGFLAASFLGYLLGVAVMALEYVKTGYSLLRALGGGVGSIEFLYVGAVFSGAPAVFAGVGLQYLLLCQRRIRSQRPPPLPSHGK